jgi:hypothetical protein
MTRFIFDSKDETIQQNGNSIEVCGSHTGHGVRAVAFCENSEIASQIVAALKLWRDEREKAIKAA